MPASAPPHSQRHTSRRWSVLLISLLGFVAIGLGITFLRPSPAQWIREGEAALAAGELSKARLLAGHVLARDSTSFPGLLLAGRVAAVQGRFREALRLFDRIPDDAGEFALAGRTESGDLALFKLKNLDLAEDHFRRALAISPAYIPAHNRLAFLLGIESRWWESSRHRLTVIRDGSHTAADLYFLSLGDRALESPNTLQAYATSPLMDDGVRLGLARHDIERQLYRSADESLQKLVASPRYALEAHALRGRCLLELNDSDGFAEWESQTTDGLKAHPAVWRTRAEWALRHDDRRKAVRFFMETLQIDPDHAATCYQLGRLLVDLNRFPDAAPLLERAQRLESYARAAEMAYRVQEMSDIQRAVETAEVAGLLWEARGWAQLAQTADSHAVWPPAVLGRLEPKLRGSDLARSPPVKLTLTGIDSAFPRDSAPPQPKLTASLPGSTATFDNQAVFAGLHFQYQNGGDPTQGLVRMSEVTGGGVAVVDYDRDGWPDLYFPQGGPWPWDRQPRPTDQLFRHDGNVRYGDVTALSALQENLFSAGATVGDFNADGFPDIYVCNLGANCLWCNQGDGTFTDVTEVATVAGEEYSASAVLADFNGDAIPDLYVVNYLAGDDLLERFCGGADGIARSCLPQSFAAAPDRFYLNLGDGRFRDMTADAGMMITPGKGLGVIAADFADTGRLDLYVVNDVGPNFLFVNETSPRGGSPLFVEHGLTAGVALDQLGRSNSGMGAAVGDVDGDGRLDLFVTNFELETNTLYRQYAERQFSDETHAAGLGKTSVPYVGWGTQFIDAELDGRLDLLIANGHVNNLEDHGKPYRMPPQYLNNVGHGRFVEPPAASLGRFFTEPSLGRGMARLDWNRDGCDDVVVSHLDRPAVLLANTTSATGHALGLRFVGVESERDAIGTTVTLTMNGRRLMRQLTAGDGNQSSNERLLVIGLGEATNVENIVIRWPSGRTQQFDHVAVDRELLLIEGRPDMHVLRIWDASPTR